MFRDRAGACRVRTALGSNLRMVLYEVNVRIAAGRAAEYRAWLGDHVAEMLGFDGFTEAEVWDDAEREDGAVHIVVHYRLRDRAALDAYLRDHAPRMRGDGLARFGDALTATRRVLVQPAMDR